MIGYDAVRMTCARARERSHWPVDMLRFMWKCVRLVGFQAGVSGAWCSGITSAPHAEGPGFNPQCVHFCSLFKGGSLSIVTYAKGFCRGALWARGPVVK